MDYRTLLAIAVVILVISGLTMAEDHFAGKERLCKQSCGCAGVEYVSETECQCKE